MIRQKTCLVALGEGLGGVGGFGSSETSKLRSTESKGCGRKDGAEALEGGEGTGVVPVVSSDVSTLGGTTAVDHDSEDDETDDGDDLDETENEFDYEKYGLIWADLMIEDTRLTFTVTADTEELNGGKDDEEHRHPDTHINIISPILDRDTRSRDFEG
jgi:hypothetical protein